VRGWPLLRALVSFVALLALGVPLWHLTRPRAAPASVESEPADGTRSEEVRLHIEFTRPARAVKVFHLGKEIWAVTSPPRAIEKMLRIEWPAEGVDLRCQIEWSEEEALAAARIQLTAPDGSVAERSLWSRGAADEILTFR
jgi:hypothetical protein